MDDVTAFLKVVLSHWGWLTTAVLAFALSAKADFGEDIKPKVALILIALASLFMAFYLASIDQYTALYESLQAR